MDLEAVTLHRDGSYGIMYRAEPAGPLLCTCGWPDGEATPACEPYSPFGRDPRNTAITEADELALDPGFYAPKTNDIQNEREGGRDGRT